MKVGSIVPAFKYFAIVLRDKPVCRLIPRIDCFSRSFIRRMMFKSPMWITPLPPSLTAFGGRSHGSILNGNYAPNRLSFARKPTAWLHAERSRKDADKDLEDRPTEERCLRFILEAMSKYREHHPV